MRFFFELSQVASVYAGLDQDKYDPHCEHVLVWDADKNIVVGTYRVLPLRRVADTVGIFSETAFDLTNIRQAHRNFLELGRACVRADYRGKPVINLLWRGVACYVQQHQLNYLGGCVCLNKEQDQRFAEQVYAYCQQHNKVVDKHLQTKPLAGHRLPNFQLDAKVMNAKEIVSRLPPIFRVYLSIGAKIGGEPAYDPELGIIDFFIFLKSPQTKQGAARFFD